MISHINKKNIGILAITLSILVWLTDRLTHAVSTILGKILYGDHYIYTVDGKISDSCCRFNIDMYLSYSLVTILILGIVLYISSQKETV